MNEYDGLNKIFNCGSYLQLCKYNSCAIHCQRNGSGPRRQRLPGVEISVANTTYGVISDYDGQYFLELNSSGKYPIRFHALGMYDTTAVNYLLGSNNMIENDFFEIGYKREIVNGLYDRIKFEYANRQPLGDIDQGPI